ncbi:MAG: methyl-accepting chemotaxis protein [Uliginosibacterium sp.]|nr:methyl-accepting chemotaxis protein [Uliginosibacterium sp.]
MKISQKFLTLLALLIGMIVLQAAVGVWIDARADARLQSMFTLRAESLSSLGAMLDDSNVVRVRLLRATLSASPETVSKELSEIDKLLANVDKAWAKAKARATSDEEMKFVTRYEASLSKYTQQRSAWIAALRGGDFEQAKAVASDKLTTEAFRDSRNAIRDLFGTEEQLAAESFKAAHADSRNALVVSATVLALALLAAILAARFLLRPIVVRLREAAHVSHEISQGNLCQTITVKGRDEVSQLLSALNEMQSSLRSSVATMRQTAERLNDQATALSDGAQHIHDQASAQGNAMNSAAAAVEELTVSINVLASSAGDTHTRVEQSGKEAHAGTDVILGTREQMRSVAETVTKASGTLKGLGDKSQQIRQIVDVIHEIAEQTNLLALNAAIEAARAGEQGRGFAVVADEVRKLAERTGLSTQQIAKVIAEVLGETEAAIGEMEGGVAKVNEGTRLAEAAGESIRQIVEGMEQINSMVTHISTAIAEQTAAANDIARSVEQIAQTGEEVVAVADNNTSTSQALSTLSKELNAVVARFKVS